MAGVMLENEGVVLEQVEGVHNFSFKVNPGLGFPPYGRSGKAFGSHGKRDAGGNREAPALQKFTSKTITSQKQLLAEVEEVARLGYAVDREEEMEGQVCVGSAVLNRNADLAEQFGWWPPPSTA